MPRDFDAGALTRAFLDRDAGALARLCKQDPEMAMLHLDGCMRGLRDGPIPNSLAKWLRDQDKQLRCGLTWDQRHAAELRILRGFYAHGGLALILGAGVSMAARMPGWQELVVDVLEYALEYGSPKDRAYVEKEVRRRMQTSEEMIALELKRILAERKPPTPEVRGKLEKVLSRLKSMKNYDVKALLDASQVAIDRFGDQYMYRLIDVLYSRTLARTKIYPAIVRMIRPRLKNPSPRLHGIITYNFDDLLQWVMHEENLGYTVHCSQLGEPVTQRGRTKDLESAVDIYHVHGIAPKSWTVMLDHLDFVFTAKQYSIQYGEERNFARQIQGGYFRNVLGLILGSSLSDDYAVQELKDAHHDNPGWFNYAVLRLPKKLRKKNTWPSNAELDEINAPYQAIGLRIIWVREFDDTPGILDSIRN